MSNEINPGNGPDGTILVEDAIAMTAKWRSYLAASEQQFAGRSFLVPIISFKNILLHNPDAEGVRAYIGLTDDADSTSAKLILVPVVNGFDVPYLPAGEEGGEGKSNVYDLSQICPPVCPTGSILDS